MENQLQLALTSPTPPLSSLLDSQKELLNSQIHQLQNIVVQQCNLTGINPLSQEMVRFLNLCFFLFEYLFL